MSTTPTSAVDPSAKSAKRTRPAVILVLAGAALVLSLVLFDSYSRPRLVSGPMVQIPAPGELVFVWNMNSVWKTGGVALNLNGETIKTAKTQPVGGNRYEARIDGLKPGEKFSYDVLNIGLMGREIKVAGPFEVQTPAPSGKPFRFLAFGDSGNGSHTQAELAGIMGTHKADVIIHTGDLIYPSGETKDYIPNFFTPYAGMIHSIPFMPCLGNHDVATEMGKPLLETFVLPPDGPKDVTPERNFYFDFGDARFVGLDSNSREFGGEISEKARLEKVAPWVREVLCNSNAKWKFVYYHHPFYTGSQHPAEGAKYMKDAFAKIFEDCGVDIVFNGHNHLYERTAPIKGDKIMPDGQGVVYIVTGAGGADRYQEVKAPDYMRVHHDEVFSFTQVDISPTSLHLRQIDENDKVIDEYIIEKRTPLN